MIWVWIEIFSSVCACGWSIIPASFPGKTTLSALNELPVHLGCKSAFHMGVVGLFLDFISVPLICLSVVSLISPCLHVFSFGISLGIK